MFFMLMHQKVSAAGISYYRHIGQSATIFLSTAGGATDALVFSCDTGTFTYTKRKTYPEICYDVIFTTVGKHTLRVYNKVNIAYCNETYEFMITDHDYKSKTVEPTCTDAGYTEYICSCGEKYHDNIISALGHSWDSEYTVDREATCTEMGTKRINCSRCNEFEITTILQTNHKWSSMMIVNEPICGEPGEGMYECLICDRLKIIEIPALKHSYGAWKIKKNATHFKQGSKYRICQNCENTNRVAIPKRAYTSNEKKQ